MGDNIVCIWVQLKRYNECYRFRIHYYPRALFDNIPMSGGSLKTLCEVNAKNRELALPG